MTEPTMKQTMALLQEMVHLVHPEFSNNREVFQAEALIKAYAEQPEAMPCMHGAIKHGFCDVCGEGDQPKAIEPLDLDAVEDALPAIEDKINEIIARLEVGR